MGLIELGAAEQAEARLGDIDRSFVVVVSDSRDAYLVAGRNPAKSPMSVKRAIPARTLALLVVMMQ